MARNILLKIRADKQKKNIPSFPSFLLLLLSLSLFCCCLSLVRGGSLPPPCPPPPPRRYATGHMHEPKTLAEARKKKNALRKIAFRKNATEESVYRKDFWSFSKRVCDGKLDHPDTKPNFTKEAADAFFSNRYSFHAKIDVTHLNWFPFVEFEFEFI